MRLDKQEVIEIKEEIKHSGMSLHTQAILLEALRGVEAIEKNDEAIHDSTCQ